MTQFASERAARFYAETYDASVSDWPGEIDFYLDIARQACADGSSVLELACGTGRVAIRLAEAGFDVLSLDHSLHMLERARKKSEGNANARWVLGDITSFKFDETFGLIIIPGHAFQNLNTPAEQIACLKSIQRQLKVG